MDTWVSTDAPHYIEQLAPGKYTLIERITPSNYDQAERIEFEVEDTGKIQACEMLDKPIKISTEIDKRQEIANPSADMVQANGDGANKADPVNKQDGMFSYSIDYRNASNTWTDEFTVYDPLDGVKAGLVKLNSLSTAQGYKDYDGKMNVWYQTNKTPADYADDKDKANATLDDGHDNPWITGDTRSDNSKKNDPDGDGRTLDYTGWKLWKGGVSTTVAETLDVSQLGLAADEYVTAIRLEYGRVEKGFTTRTSAWDRDELKDNHDDMNLIEYLHADKFTPERLVEAIKSNLGTLISFVKPDTDDKSDTDNKQGTDEKNGKLTITEDDQKAIDDIIDRIDEGTDAGSPDEVSTAIDDAKTLVSSKLEAFFDSGSFDTSKGMKAATDTLTEAFGRVENALPKDVKSKATKALETAGKAIDSGDPEELAESKKQLQSACESIVDSLTTNAATSTEINYSPLVLNMQTTNAYRNKVELVNTASVIAYRNGGGKDLQLEGEDSDKVVQVPTADSDVAEDFLAQTGRDVLGIASVGIIAAGIAFAIRRKRMA